MLHYCGSVTSVAICIARSGRSRKFHTSSFVSNHFLELFVTFSFSSSSCSGSTGTSHCIMTWFDAHIYKCHQTAASIGALLQDNMPVLESERVFHRKHGVVTLLSLQRAILESCFGREYFLCFGNFPLIFCFSWSIHGSTPRTWI